MTRMTVQLCSIRHNGSGVQQSLFVCYGNNGNGPTTFEFQSVPPRSWAMNTVHKALTRDEVLEHLRVYRDLAADGDLSLRQFDRLTLRSIAGVDSLELVTGDAPARDA